MIYFIDLLAKLYRKQLAKVKVAGTLSEWFRVKKWVRQGCVLSPYLFNILAEMVMRETLDGFQGGLQPNWRANDQANLNCRTACFESIHSTTGMSAFKQVLKTSFFIYSYNTD